MKDGRNLFLKLDLGETPKRLKRNMARDTRRIAPPIIRPITRGESARLDELD